MNSDRRVLIDNATLSGVERITGTSKTINLNYIDNDILCLEKLVTAILFSDKIIGVDDYKEQFRATRLKKFNFVEFLEIDQATYATYSEESAKFAREMTFSFEGAIPTGDVVHFFEALKIDPQMRWNIFVSSEYLTLSYLVDDATYSPYEASIDSAFRHEITDRAQVKGQHTRDVGVKDLVQAFKSGNPQFTGTDNKSALDRVVFGYGWTAERSHFYNTVAQAERADVYLAPLRDAFCESCCRIDYPSQIDTLLNNLKNNSQKTLTSILGPSGQANFAIRLPFFVAYLISQTDNPNQCIELALELRNASDFQESRKILQDLDQSPASDRILGANKILNQLERVSNGLMKKYGVSTSNGPQFSFSLGLFGPNVSVGGKLDHLFQRDGNKPVSRLFRNIAQDMINVERLGGLREKVCSSMRKHPDARHTDISTTPSFMKNRENEFGRPATLPPKKDE